MFTTCFKTYLKKNYNLPTLKKKCIGTRLGTLYTLNFEWIGHVIRVISDEIGQDKTWQQNINTLYTTPHK